ncbi:hypothetical protein GH714_018141 [Hevea brasiliensis]|uniref:RNase III domain-containing protein n=1 Tax=Hevea brasiliensis TaxID=3981 RepID=A0A6A6KTB0_HEVBR|nr:hypothetical protein GH714_018141 [Hevea brasiliensis]
MAYHQEPEPELEVDAFHLNSESNQMESLPSLDEVEEILGYKFENWRLLEEAFTDSSFPDKRVSYERLEHVGVFKNLLEPIISPEMLKIHPVTELYELCQKKHLKVKFVDLWRESMAFDVFIDDQLVGRGTYGLKKEIAHNRAAKDALDNLGRILGEKDSTDES